MTDLANYYYGLIISNPNLKRFLDLIGFAEGATYNTGFGGRRINSLRWHPYPVGAFPHKNDTTSAAGKYQYQRNTWDGVAKQVGLKDFTPKNQDIGAVHLIKRNRALQDVLSGNIASAILKLKEEWQGFAVRPLNVLLNKFSTGNFRKIDYSVPQIEYGVPQSETQFGDSYEVFKKHLGIKIITDENRYYLAFVIITLVISLYFLK